MWHRLFVFRFIMNSFKLVPLFVLGITCFCLMMILSYFSIMNSINEMIRINRHEDVISTFFYDSNHFKQRLQSQSEANIDSTTMNTIEKLIYKTVNDNNNQTSSSSPIIIIFNHHHFQSSLSYINHNMIPV